MRQTVQLSQIALFFISLANYLSIDQSGLYSSKTLKILENIQNYLEPFIPLDIAESMIGDIFKDYSKDCAFKLATLKILHFPERGTVLNLGISLKSD